MKIILAYAKNNEFKIKVIGNTLDTLILLVAISKFLVEKISEEKKINMDIAERIVMDCILDGMKTVKKQ